MSESIREAGGSGGEVRRHESDVLVIGGGPGGSTISAFLVRRGRSVIMVDKDHHPRFHIGESLLPMNMPILERLGVLDKVRAMGVVKHGADFTYPGDSEYKVYDFGNAYRSSPPNAYEVTRSEYDEMLFRNAAEQGVETHEGIRVTEVRFDKDGVVADARGEDGTRHVFRARYLVDATGRDTFLSNKLKLKKKNREHASAAIFSHFSGVERRPGNQEGNISIYWFDNGWMWLIPLKNDVMSVGAVCHPDYIKQRPGTTEEFLLDTIKRCPEAWARFGKAKRVADVRSTGNYSYKSDRMAGPGFIMVGDAFAFIDPVFSSGVYLAMNSAEIGAEIVDDILREPHREAELQARFDARVRRGVGTFSWFIYRFTTPGLQWIFRHPRNVYRLQDAVTSMLAGDVFGDPEIEKRFIALKALYALRSAAEIKRYVKSFWQRRRNTQVGFSGGTLATDRDQEQG